LAIFELFTKIGFIVEFNFSSTGLASTFLSINFSDCFASGFLTFEAGFVSS